MAIVHQLLVESRGQNAAGPDPTVLSENKSYNAVVHVRHWQPPPVKPRERQGWIRICVLQRSPAGCLARTRTLFASRKFETVATLREGLSSLEKRLADATSSLGADSTGGPEPNVVLKVPGQH